MSRIFSASKTGAAVSLRVALERNFRQLDRSPNQLRFMRRGASRIAPVDLQCSQETFVPREDSYGRKNIQTQLHGALGDGTEITLLPVRQRDERYHVANLNIDRDAQPVQDLRERRAQRYQLENLVFLLRRTHVAVAMATRPKLPVHSLCV
jgi:hypothetical protein